MFVNRVALCLALGASLLVSGAQALERVVLGYTNLSQNSLDFIAQEMGYFTEEGLQVELVSTSGTSTLVPTLVSGSIQIATVPPPVLVQAASSGLKLVAISGLSEVDPKAKDTALIRRTSSEPLLPDNIKGKKLAVSTIGSISQILLDDWLSRRGVASSTFTYVEVPFNQMQTVLRQGAVDAGLFPEPFLTSTIQSGDGKIESYFIADLPPGVMGMINIADAAWAQAHPDTIARFRRALDKALAYALDHPADVKKIVGKWLKLPDRVMDVTIISGQRVVVTATDLAWWLELMRKQKLVEGPLDPAALVLR